MDIRVSQIVDFSHDSPVGEHRSVPLLNPGGFMNMPEKMEFRANLHNALPQNGISIVNLFREVKNILRRLMGDENISCRQVCSYSQIFEHCPDFPESLFHEWFIFILTIVAGHGSGEVVCLFNQIYPVLLVDELPRFIAPDKLRGPWIGMPPPEIDAPTPLLGIMKVIVNLRRTEKVIGGPTSPASSSSDMIIAAL